jgi:protein kinase-like protein
MRPDEEPAEAPTEGELLLAEAIEAFEAEASRGQPPELDAFCARYPSIREPLRQVLALGRQLAALGAGGAPAVPEKLGPYRILEELGRGGMAPVFRARDERLGRDVALKVLLPGPEPAGRERFLREARVLARISHPHVVPIYDVGEEGPWCYLAMELLHGSLQAEVDRRVDARNDPEAARRAVRWVLDAAEGLRHAHAQGVLHRDVKPANLLLDAAGRVRVADFGLAAVEDTARLTGPGAGLGTPGYAAPEQVRGEPLDVRCDVYGLGATLRALLGPGSPAALDAAIGKATASERVQRHPDVTAFARDLRAWLDEAQTGRRRPRARVAAVVGGLALAALGLAALWSGWRPANRPETHKDPDPRPGILVSVSSEVMPVAEDGAAEPGRQVWEAVRRAHGGSALDRVRAVRSRVSVTAALAAAGTDLPRLHATAVPRPLSLLLDPSIRVLAVGTAEVGQPGQELALESSEGPASVLVSGDDGRIVEMRYRAPDAITETYSDYRRVQGVWLPFRQEIRRGGTLLWSLAVESIELEPGGPP